MTAAPGARTSSELGGETAADEGAIATIRRGLALTPELLRGLWITLLLIAYRKSTISLADRVVFLDHGRVADVGPHEELRARSAGYRALVDAYDEAAISHSLLEASKPPPSDAPEEEPDPVTGAIEIHGATRHRHEEAGADEAECEPPTRTGGLPAVDADQEAGR